MSAVTSNEKSLTRAAAPALNEEEVAYLKRMNEALGKTQSVLVVAMLILHEHSHAQNMITPDGKQIKVQGLVDSCAFVCCVVQSILRHIEKEWDVSMRPRVVLGYLNYAGGSDSASYVSVPHLWVETFHERIAELCLKSTQSAEQAERERVRITDIAGGITHQREKMLLGRPFHTDVTERGDRDGSNVMRPTYSRDPLGTVPQMPHGTMEQLRLTEQNPLSALEQCGGRRMKSMYLLILKKLKEQAAQDDVGKYKFNLNSLEMFQTQELT